MNNNPVTVEKLFDAPVDKVWKAITDKAQMKEWYFDLDDFKPEKDFEFSFAGQGRKGEEYIHLCKIIEVVPYKKLQYSWQYKDRPGYSVVTFELFDEDDRTLLKLTHTGLESFAVIGPDFARKSFAGGWDEIINVSLEKFLLKA